MTRITVIVGHGLIHFHVDVESVQKYGCVFVRHQVANESVLWNAPVFGDLWVRLVCSDDLFGPFLVIKWIKYFIESGIALFLFNPNIRSNETLIKILVSIDGIKTQLHFRSKPLIYALKSNLFYVFMRWKALNIFSA